MVRLRPSIFKDPEIPIDLGVPRVPLKIYRRGFHCGDAWVSLEQDPAPWHAMDCGVVPLGLKNCDDLGPKKISNICVYI